MKGVYAIDQDRAVLSVFPKNIRTKTECIDLATFSDQHVSLLEGIDVIAAGPPYQGFSMTLTILTVNATIMHGTLRG